MDTNEQDEQLPALQFPKSKYLITFADAAIVDTIAAHAFGEFTALEARLFLYQMAKNVSDHVGVVVKPYGMVTKVTNIAEEETISSILPPENEEGIAIKTIDGEDNQALLAIHKAALEGEDRVEVERVEAEGAEIRALAKRAKLRSYLKVAVIFLAGVAAGQLFSLALTR